MSCKWSSFQTFLWELLWDGLLDKGSSNQRMSVLSDRRIILGVTGSIAAYKAADLASKLAQAGAQVDGDCRSCNTALPV